MEQFFVSSKTILFSSFKQMLDADAVLDRKLMNFMVLQSSLGVFYFLLKVNFIEISLLFLIRFWTWFLTSIF